MPEMLVNTTELLATNPGDAVQKQTSSKPTSGQCRSFSSAKMPRFRSPASPSDGYPLCAVPYSAFFLSRIASSMIRSACSFSIADKLASRPGKRLVSSPSMVLTCVWSARSANVA
jgi:hypothetical protein